MNYGTTKKFSGKAVITALRKAILALLTPVIILGGIYSGFFTPTEAAVVTVIYALLIGMFVYKSITLQTLPKIILASGQTTASIMFIMCAISCLSLVLSMEMIPEHLAATAIKYVSSPLAFLLISNCILIVAGMIENGSSCILLLAPLLHPIAMQYGIDPIFYGAMFVANLAIGMITPPVAMTLYVASRICKVPMVEMTKAIIPFFFVLLTALALFTCFPQIALFLPNLLLGI